MAYIIVNYVPGSGWFLRTVLLRSYFLKDFCRPFYFLNSHAVCNFSEHFHSCPPCTEQAGPSLVCPPCLPWNQRIHGPLSWARCITLSGSRPVVNPVWWCLLTNVWRTTVSFLYPCLRPFFFIMPGNRITEFSARVLIWIIHNKIIQSMILPVLLSHWTSVLCLYEESSRSPWECI